MKTIHSSRTRWLIVGLAVLLTLGLYLNRAYAFIYNHIGDIHLLASDRAEKYLINPKNGAATGTPPLIYVALGDSLTAGVGTEQYADSYPYQLAQTLAAGSGRPVTLYDRSWPGERTASLLRDYVPLAVADQPDIITLLIGINDMHGNISIETFRTRYAAILKQLTTRTNAKIYVINIPFLGSPQLMHSPYQWYFDYETRRFNAVIRQLATQYRLTYIDLYAPTVNLFKAAGPDYSADFFHPSPAGYKIWVPIIYSYLHQ